MRIALVIFRAEPGRGGAERYTVDLAEALSQRGHDVSLLASSFGDVPAGVMPVAVAAEGLTRLGRYERYLDALDRHLADSRYDVVHAMLPVRRCDLYHPHAGIAAEAVAPGSGAGVRGWVNRLNRKRRRFAQVERELLLGPRPPVVLCLSEVVRQSLARFYTLRPGRTDLLFNGVDLARFHPDGDLAGALQLRQRFGIGPGRVVGLVVAQNFARKGLAEAIEALPATAPELTLVAVGKQNPRPYQQAAERRGVAGRVVFAGATTDIASFYRAADFFLLPTYQDSCSLVVLEALAMGLPVISTRQNGACEIMTDGREGFVLENPANIPRLTQAMNELMSPDRRRAMKEAALALRPKLSYEHHLEQLLGIYTRLAAGEGR